MCGRIELIETKRRLFFSSLIYLSLNESLKKREKRHEESKCIAYIRYYLIVSLIYRVQFEISEHWQAIEVRFLLKLLDKYER